MYRAQEKPIIVLDGILRAKRLFSTETQINKIKKKNEIENNKNRYSVTIVPVVRLSAGYCRQGR